MNRRVKAAGSSCEAKKDVILRSPGGRDLSGLLDLIREYYRYDGLRFEVERIRPALRKLLRDKSLGKVWTIHHGTETAGYAILTFNYDLEFG